MKKILFIISSLDNSGPCKVLENQISALNKKEYEVCVMTFFKGDSILEKEIECKIEKFICLNTNRLSCFLNPHKIIDVIKKIEPDIVHSHGLLPDYINSKLKNIKKINTLHCNIYSDYNYEYGKLKGKMYILLHLYALKKLDKVICCSKSVLIDMKKSNLNNLQYVRNGIEINYKFNNINARKQYDIKNSDIVYIYVGRLIYRKNILNLVKKMSKIIKENEHFFIIGDGPMYDEILKFNNKNIHVLGYKNNPIDYLNESDVYISASLMEGLSISVIEALDNNKMVFLSDIQSHKEFFEIDNSYYLGELFNFNDFENKIELLRNKIVFNEKNTNEFKQRYLSSSSMIREYENIYDELLKGEY